MPLILYHYTDKSGYRGIKSSKRIRKTAENDPHAWFGGGVYFTSIPPKRGKLSIAKNNYKRGGRNMMKNGRVGYFIKVEFKRNDENVKRVGGKSRKIYLYKDNDIDLNKYRHKFGVTPGSDSDSSSSSSSSSSSDSDSDF